MDNTQALINGLLAGLKEERAKTQMTLGNLIDRLKELDPAIEMEGIGEPHSYRGYYSDLAFERCKKRKVADVLIDVQKCMGETFQGYKGGHFDMGRGTPVWIAEYGCCGSRMLAIDDDGTIVTSEDD